MYTSLNIPPRLRSIHGSLCWKESLVASAEELRLHGSGAFNLALALEDSDQRDIPRKGHFQ